MVFNKKKFWWLFWAVIILSILIRLRGFDNHFLLASDSGRDLLVAKGAILAKELPWVGSFSSAGPFVFGPNWYWFLMLPLLLFPNIFLAPWFFMFLISILFVAVMGIIGKVIFGKRFGLLTALVCAVSTMAIGQSAYLTQHAGVEICATFTLLGFVLYLKTKRLLFIFLMALGIGAAISLHYQGIYLGVYFLAPLILNIKSFKKLLQIALVSFLGISIPLIPLFLWDVSRGFRNTIELFYFYRVGQYRFYVPNRWLTYLGVFWPQFLGKFISGIPLVGGLIAVWGVALLGIKILQRRLPKLIFWPAFILAVQVLLFRYYRGERYEGYVIYLHPVILLLLSWTIYQIIKWKAKIGYLLFMILFVLTMKSNMAILDWSNNVDRVNIIATDLKKSFPNEKFTLYGRNLATSNCAYALSWILESQNLNSEAGRPIGICMYNFETCPTAGIKYLQTLNFQNDICAVVDLKEADSKELIKKNGWYPFSTLAVFSDVQHWWKK